jgi:hypothetical protein
MIIGTWQKIASLIDNVALSIGGISLCKVRHVKCLGVTIDENLMCKKHVDNVIKKVSIGMGLLRRTRNFLTEKQLITIYHSIIEYHSIIGQFVLLAGPIILLGLLTCSKNLGCRL